MKALGIHDISSDCHYYNCSTTHDQTEYSRPHYDLKKNICKSIEFFFLFNFPDITGKVHMSTDRNQLLKFKTTSHLARVTDAKSHKDHGHHGHHV